MKFEHPISIAPMMQRTDRHYRFMMRQITRRTLLYTEMVTARALLHGDADRLLRFDEVEHPLSLQLGGDDPREMAEAARIGADYGYDEINVNVGCPSPRVSKGNFGACLMQTPDVVARIVEAMRAAVEIPVTVKHRIGVDDLDRYEDMLRFVDTVGAAGCERFTVHARKAWLQGLSPRENREIPPLRYADVYRLKTERPRLTIEINGGVRDLGAVDEALGRVDAVMIGRAAYDDPMLFAAVDERYYGAAPREVTRDDVVVSLYPYIERQLELGTPLQAMTRHLASLFTAQPGGRFWRRTLSERSHLPDADVSVVVDALAAREEAASRVLRART